VRPFRFPDDHGPHPDFRSEWWYFTGNVVSPGGRRFGFQLTFFRFALTPEAPARDSAWASNQVYMAHFAVSDVTAGRFHAAESFSREALDLAGARAAPFAVWLGSWRARAEGHFFPLTLHAEDGGYAIDLRLDAGKPVVLNGEQGLSRKSAEPGNASYYYSIPRIPVNGRISTPAGDWQVSGSAWFDREWSSSALGADQVGWDWFALQLSDGRDLMVYRLRTRDGGTDPASGGTLVEADGRARGLDADAFALEVLEHWSSPRDGARYPARWRLRVPSAAIDVQVTPEFPDQELDLTFRYFEGASRVSGTSDSVRVTGHGHVELTGYASGGASLAR
jgi:predicted secreted hydrolase